MKQLAETCLVHPADQSTLQAFATGLLFAQIGWNSALGHDMGQLEPVLREIERDNPALWDELRSRDPAVLIAQVRAAKLRQHPDDDRVIVVCGVIDEVIRVEWCRQADFPALQERLGSPLAPVGVVCRKPTTARTRPAFTAPAARRDRRTFGAHRGR